jgi:thiamine biosynthesis lipoprotein
VIPVSQSQTQGQDAAQWPVWSTTTRLVVTRPDRLRAARQLVERRLAEVDAVASRFRVDSEVNRTSGGDGRPQTVSPLLAELIEIALDAARGTDGDVDPTIGEDLHAIGYDRDIEELRAVPQAAPRVTLRRRPSWRRVRLEGRTLSLPAGTILDLGATAKAYTADLCARQVADDLGTGVLVSLGGDIATAGDGPDGGWRIRVQDGPQEPGCTVTLAPGHAIATSSTLRRRWWLGARSVHHVIDPSTGRPAEAVWRTVTAAARRCVHANTLTTAALVRGAPARSWLDGLNVPARLVSARGDVITVGGWPEDEVAA